MSAAEVNDVIFGSSCGGERGETGHRKTNTNLRDGGDLMQVWAMALAFRLYPTHPPALLCLLRLISIASSRWLLSAATVTPPPLVKAPCHLRSFLLSPLHCCSSGTAAVPSLWSFYFFTEQFWSELLGSPWRLSSSFVQRLDLTSPKKVALSVILANIKVVI